jgi:hypothetical protein
MADALVVVLLSGLLLRDIMLYIHHYKTAGIL